MLERQPYNYSPADIKRYVSGEMSPAEMHRMEKAALDDAFLAEALEGYINMPGSEQEIKRLVLKHQAPSVIGLFRRPWLRVAAALLLLAGAGYISYLVLSGPNRELADHKETYRAKKQANISDSIREHNISLENRDSSSEIQETVARSSDSKVLPRQSRPSKNRDALDRNGVASTTRKVQGDKEPSAAAALEQTFEGKVTDNQGQPMANAIVTDLENNKKTVTDQNGRFLLTAKDSGMIVKVEKNGNEAKLHKYNGTADSNTLAGAPSLEEVVVSGYRRSKKSEMTTMREPRKLYSEPVIGWQAFKAYTDSSIRLLKNTDTSSLRGQVTLEFSVTRKGKPRDISIRESLCIPCEKAAVKILLNGPRWKRTNKRVVVSIEF